MSTVTETTARAALTEVIASELRRSEQTMFLGETVRGLGAAGVAAGLYDEFGEAQVIETPVSENGIFGAVLGLALSGQRPIVEIYSADFLLAVANEVINDIAKWRQQQGESGPLPITIRGCMGANRGLGPEHSQCMEAYLHHAPGLSIVVPGTPADAAGLLRAAIRSPDPVIVLEHRRVYDLTGEVPIDPDFTLPLGCAETVRSGEDATLLAWGWMGHEARAAAERLAEGGISVELIDPRTIRPFDWDAVFASVRRTGCLLIAEESPLTGNVGAEIVARTVEQVGPGIRAKRVCMPDAIHPYSPELEAAVLPTADQIVAGVEALVGEGR